MRRRVAAGLLVARNIAASGPGAPRLFADHDGLAGICVCGCQSGAIPRHTRSRFVNSGNRLSVFGRGADGDECALFPTPARCSCAIFVGPGGVVGEPNVVRIAPDCRAAGGTFPARSLHPLREIVGALVFVVASTYLITSTLKRSPTHVLHLGAWFPDSQQLLPGVIFLLSVVWYRRRLWRERTAFDRAIYATAYVNLAAQLAASQSEQLLDAPFALAQGLTVIGYVTALAGGLLDNARLFHQVHYLSVSDPLTGLANYRKLLDVLDKEAERRIGPDGRFRFY